MKVYPDILWIFLIFKELILSEPMVGRLDTCVVILLFFYDCSTRIVFLYLDTANTLMINFCCYAYSIQKGS